MTNRKLNLNKKLEIRVKNWDKKNPNLPLLNPWRRVRLDGGEELPEVIMYKKK